RSLGAGLCNMRVILNEWMSGPAGGTRSATAAGGGCWPHSVRESDAYLDVPDLRMDLRRGGGLPRGRDTAGYPLGGRASELGVPRVRCAQRGFRADRDLN